MKKSCIATAILLASCVPLARFQIEDDGKHLSVAEDGNNVLVYNYQRVDPPEGVPKEYQRSSYIHPLYGLDGDVLSQDFPSDHFHHRGLYWTWPNVMVGDRRADIWFSLDVHQTFEKWLAREATADAATVAVQNVWAFDDTPDKPFIRAQVRFTVLPADDVGRCIDFELTFTNISDKTVAFAPKDYKGYGGFCLRPDDHRKPFTFTTAKGPQAEDTLECDTPWADVSSHSKPDGPVSGVAMFQHPSNPGYPHPGWILRHYGFLGASWPHTETHALQPDESFTLRYRVFIHRGTAEEADVKGRFAAYTEQVAANK